MAGTTPTYGLRYPELVDPPDGEALGKNLADDVEAELERVDAELDGVTGETAYQPYAVTWSIEGVGIGSVGSGGGCNGRYRRIGNTVHYRIYLRLGNGATPGGSTWSFNLPFTAVVPSEFGTATLPIGNAACYDASANHRLAVPVILAGAPSTAYVMTPADGLLLSNSHPFAWVWGDSLVIHGTYEAE